MGYINIAVPTMDIIFADEFGFIGLVDGGLQVFTLTNIFAAHINIGGVAGHAHAGDQAAFHQQMRIMAHDLAVFARAGFGFVGIHNKIMRALAHNLGHEAPFETCREASATTATQARGFNLVHNPIATLVDEGLGIKPRATKLCAF